MSAHTDDPRSHFLTRSDFAQMAVPDERVHAWMTAGSIEQIGELSGADGADPVFAVRDDDLRAELTELLTAIGKAQAALAPDAARSELLKVLTREQPADGASAADGDGDLGALRAAHINDPVARTMENVSKAMAELLAVADEAAPPAADDAQAGNAAHDDAAALPPDLEVPADVADGDLVVVVGEADSTDPTHLAAASAAEAPAAVEDDGTEVPPADLPTIEADAASATPRRAAKYDLSGLDEVGPLQAPRDQGEVRDDSAGIESLFGPTPTAPRVPADTDNLPSTAAADAVEPTVDDAMDVLFASEPSVGEDAPPADAPAFSPRSQDVPPSPATIERQTAPTPAAAPAPTFATSQPPAPAIAPAISTPVAPTSDSPTPIATAAAAAAASAPAVPTATGPIHVELTALTEPLQQIQLALLTLAERPLPVPEIGPLVNSIDNAVVALRDAIGAASTAAAQPLGERIERLTTAVIAGNAALAEAIDAHRRARQEAPPQAVGAVPVVRMGPTTAAMLPIGLMVLGWCGALWLHTGDPRIALLALLGANALGCVALVWRRR